jgi:hypothetical protein
MSMPKISWSSRKTWVALALVGTLVVHAVIWGLRARHSAFWEDVRAREAQELSRGYRFAPMLVSNSPYHLIGDLAKNPRWTERLRLDEDQAEAITKLDDLVRDARDYSLLLDADYVEGVPDVYREYATRNDARRTKTIRHAQRMVTLGLLTEPQAAFVMQRYLVTTRSYHTLGNENVQQRLGMTEDQKRRLAAVWENQNSQQARLNLFSTDPREQKKNRAVMNADSQAAAVAALSILTPDQRTIWSRLTAARSLSAEPPDLPPSSDADAAKFKLVFRALSEKTGALNLAAEQKKLLKTLEDVTRDGLLWIESQPGDRASQKRTQFVKQAEQVALLGILTERQAEQVEADIKKS